MTQQLIARARSIRGQLKIPGDKSISHRGLILGAMASGTTELVGLLDAGDTRSTQRCLSDLGVTFHRDGDLTRVIGLGDRAFTAPEVDLDCGNSGTTLRLLMGVLSSTKASRPLITRLTGDSSLVRRPMKRVAEPLRLMGAQIALTHQDFAPLTIQSAKLHGIDYPLKVASAQLKSALLLAGISSEGTLSLRGEIQSRDHTERLFPHFGISVQASAHEIRLEGGQRLKAARVHVPGDPSTAAFWLAAASLLQDSRIEMKNVSLNPTRLGFLNALQRMGARISTEIGDAAPEPRGNIQVETSELRGIHIEKTQIPDLIDELPMLAVVATQAHGVTEVVGAEELRVKESDRLEAIAAGLRAMGAEIQLRPDGFKITGPQKLKSARIESFHDHRIAMAFSIAALLADDRSGPTRIEDAECVAISYPAFFQTLARLTNHVPEARKIQ